MPGGPLLVGAMFEDDAEEDDAVKASPKISTKAECVHMGRPPNDILVGAGTGVGGSAPVEKDEDEAKTTTSWGGGI